MKQGCFYEKNNKISDFFFEKPNWKAKFQKSLGLIKKIIANIPIYLVQEKIYFPTLRNSHNEILEKDLKQQQMKYYNCD